VLQWLPFGDVANIVSRWVRRWDGDQGRRTQLLTVVDSHLADQRFLDTQAYRMQPSEETTGLQPVAVDDPVASSDGTIGATGAIPVLADGRLDDLRAWYARMAPCWLAIEPPLRRRLVLQTHAWIAERVSDDTAQSRRRPRSASSTTGPLPTAPAPRRPEDRVTWGPWIELVRSICSGRSRASRPPDAAWARWLFFIPYSVPTPAGAHPLASRRGDPASA
jgi:hypothetical protein